MFLEVNKMEKLEISPAVQKMLTAMKNTPANFKVGTGLMKIYEVEDLTTGIKGGVSFDRSSFFSYIEVTCVGDLSFLNAKEAEAVHTEIMNILDKNIQADEENARARFENAYSSSSEAHS